MLDLGESFLLSEVNAQSGMTSVCISPGKSRNESLQIHNIWRKMIMVSLGTIGLDKVK